MGDVAADASAPPAEAGPPSKSTNPFMLIVENPDGTITRPFFAPCVPPVSEPGSAVAALSKDVPLDAALGTSLRFYLPHPAPAEKLPIILFFHGGGFVLFNSSSVFYHASCEAMAAALPALVLSLDYRLAPEHRLPAAHDDAVAALLWLRAQAALGPAGMDPWLAAHGDFSRCFVMGSSSGGNMAYHAGLRARSLELLPEVKLAGAILNQPYFGGVERTPSEANSEEDFMLPLEGNDKLWRLALPEGADRGHEFSNPKATKPSGLVRCMVLGVLGDPLFDRQKEFAEWLRGEGVDVAAKLDEAGGFHSIELFVPEKAEALFANVREFVYHGDA